MKLYEMEYRKELKESLLKLHSLAKEASIVLKNLEESEDSNLIKGLESYNQILEQEKSVIDWIVVVVNNMFENGLMDLKEATEWYNKSYEARKIAEAGEAKLKEIMKQ